MKKIGFIGLGTMGKPMATNLAKAGFELTVFDLNPRAMAELQDLGAKAADGPAAVASATEVLMTMLPAPPEVEQVYLGKEGVLAGAHNGLICIDSSSIDPATTRKVAAELAKVGTSLIDAPVGGGLAHARAGNLVMLVGGDKAVMEACRPVLETVGERVLYCGPTGSGAATKLCNNLMTMIFVFMLSEGYALARASGVDTAVLHELQNINIPRLLAASVIVNPTPGCFDQGFQIKLAHKDLRLAQRMAEEAGVPIPLASLVKEIYQKGILRGLGALANDAAALFYEREGTF